MVTSRFQLGLIATLAVGLGFSLASSEAVGYPAGAAVSMGSHPVFSVAGTINSGETPLLVTTGADQDLIITDVQLQLSDIDDGFDCMTKWHVELQADSAVVGSWALRQYRHFSDGDSYTPGAAYIDSSYRSGIRVSGGSELVLSATRTNSSSCSGGSDVRYTLSGYYAQP